MADPDDAVAAREHDQQIRERVALLSSNLKDAGDHYRRLAKRTYRLNAAIMVLTVGLSLVGGIGGLTGVIGARLAGAFALLPGLLAVFSTTMKFQAKANQYYRRKDALQLLRNRLLFELPVSPNEADVAAISHEWGELTNRMNDEYERSLQFEWANFAGNGRSSARSDHAPHSP